ncbi:MAG TPA: DNA alkylation repair protein [Vicinamibacterales bacterium]|nr:DNA alkylation repair protein [Vicinamibacterales bacterium]
MSKPASSVSDVVAWLKRSGSRKARDGMARYGLPSEHAVGISVGALKTKAKALGRDHDLAIALWKTGIYEARLLAAFVGDPVRVTPAEMDRWCKDFDNWGVVDTVCFSLWDRTPHAFAKVRAWATRKPEFEKRAAFALLACLALHDKATKEDRPFLDSLKLIERAADDERNFVKKGVSWALRLVGRRSRGLHAASLALSTSLAKSTDPTERWLGKEALRDLGKPAVMKKVNTDSRQEYRKRLRSS